MNKQKITNEYINIIKQDPKIIKTVLEDRSITNNLTLGFLGVFIGMFLINIINIFYITLFIYILVMYKNQILIDKYIYSNLNNDMEINKLFATLSKLHYKKIFLSISIILGLYYLDILYLNLNFFNEIVIYYMIIEIMKNIYYSIFKINFHQYFIAYLYQRVDFYITNELFENLLNNKFQEYYGDKTK